MVTQWSCPPASAALSMLWQKHLLKCALLFLEDRFIGGGWGLPGQREHTWSTMSCSSCCCSVAKPCLTLFDPQGSTPGFPVLHYLPEFAQIHIHWVGDAIKPLHPLPTHFSFCLQSFPASGSFPMSRLFTLGGQSTGALATILPMNTQGWFPLGLTGLILQSKGLSRVLSNTTIWKHSFFDAQSPLASNSHIHTWLLEKPQLWLYGPLSANWCLCFIIKNNNFERFCQIPLQWGWSNSSPPSSA